VVLSRTSIMNCGITICRRSRIDRHHQRRPGYSALAQVGKSGFMFILNRETGEPVHGVVERPVAKGDVPGEWYPPTQPIPVKPGPIARVSMTEKDLVTAEDTTPEHAQACKELWDKNESSVMRDRIRRGSTNERWSSDNNLSGNDRGTIGAERRRIQARIHLCEFEGRALFRMDSAESRYNEAPGTPSFRFADRRCGLVLRIHKDVSELGIRRPFRPNWSHRSFPERLLSEDHRSVCRATAYTVPHYGTSFCPTVPCMPVHVREWCLPL